MPPPPPPPIPPAPLMNKLNSTTQSNNNNNVLKLKKSKNEPTDVGALLSQIREGAKLKKASTNDRSAPVVAGSQPKANETKSITPSMFKNGTNPLNLNFKLPTPLGGSTNLNSNKKPNQSSSNLNSAGSSLSTKSNLSSLSSTVNSKKDSSSESFNSSAGNIARSLTLRSPSKSILTQDNNKSIRSDTINRSGLSTKSDRPTVKPPPLPLKPPAINRRQSFDSGQLNARQLNSSSSSTNSSIADSSSIINHKLNKPPPPPRYFATMKPQMSPVSQSQKQNNQNQMTTTTRPHKSTQNLSTLNNTMGNHNSTNLNYSTLKIKPNTKNYPSTRPMNAPPPPPPKLPSNSNYSSNNSFSNMQSSQLSYNSSQKLNPNIPKPPPLPSPNLPLNSAPLPPSLTSAMSNLSQNTSSNAFYETINSQTIAPPVPQINYTSKDLETRYKSQFVDISLLPTPDPFTGCKKTYSIAMGKSKIRSRAPLPPTETSIGPRSSLLNI